MHRKQALLALLLITSIVLNGCRGLVAGGTTTTGGGTTVTADLKSINHIVYMLQENRTFDNYFSNLNAYRAGKGLSADADVAPAAASNPTFDGTSTVQRFKLDTVCIENVSPAWNETHVQMNRQYQFQPASQITSFTMDGFVYTAAKYARDQTNPPFIDTEGHRTMGYYTENELPYYYFMATQFATSDRWFSPAPSNSPTNRLMAFAGTAEGWTYPPTSTLSAKPIWQLLQENNITWKIYSPEVQNTYLLYFQPFANAHLDRVVPASQFATDAAAGTLPQVAFIEAGSDISRIDEHPSNNVQSGAATVAGYVNALMASPSWKDSLFILSWDEGGGIYDHVPPPAAVKPDTVAPKFANSTDIQGDFDFYGLRVPFIFISPYAKKGFISHTVHDHTAILRLIEQRFSLPTLTARDAAQSDMLEFFDFSAPNLTPPTPPAQPTNAPCYYDRTP